MHSYTHLALSSLLAAIFSVHAAQFSVEISSVIVAHPPGTALALLTLTSPCLRRTYGKGLIQSVYQLDDGSALVLTVGKYRTPASEVDRLGISPDFPRQPSAADADAALAACRVPTAPQLAQPVA